MNNLGAYIEQVARHYWGEPNSKRGHTLRWGTHGSKEVDLQKGTWFDFEQNIGGGVTHLVRHNEGSSLASMPDILERKFGISKQTQKSIEPARFMSKCYDYVDENGEIKYQVLRYEPKTFRQRQPDGNGGWVYNMEGVVPLPYNLPAILKNKDKPIFIVEGEKCADRLIEMGVLATTSHGGAGKFRSELAQWFEGRDVVIIPDADEAGERHAQVVISQLVGVSKSVRKVDLPELQAKQDIVDWLDAGHTKKELAQLVKQSEIIADKPAEVPQDIVADAPDIFPTYNMEFLRNMPPVEWLVDGLLTRHGFAIAYGEPGSGKSFLAIDIALSVAYGRAWAGKEVRQGAVLYIAGEGVGGLGKRVKAWCQSRGVEGDAPFFVLPTAVRFREQDEVEKLMRTISSFGQQFTLVVVDTVARALLGGDENSATDAGLFVAACDAIGAHAGCAVWGIHHSGKDATRGMRGSSSLLGAVSTSIRIIKDEETVNISVEKQKDAEPIDAMQFEMVEVASLDDSSIVLEPVNSLITEMRPEKTRLTPAQRLAYEAFCQAVDQDKTDHCSVARWHELHRQNTPDETAGKRRDARAAVQAKGLVRISDNFVWLVKNRTA